MNRTEYQRLRRQLDEELRAGIDMLQAGYRAKVEALDALWGEPLFEVPASESEVDASPPLEPTAPIPPEPPEPAAPTAEARSARRGNWEMETDIEAALEQLGDVFDKSDLCRALGYEPPRTSLYRALTALQRERILEIESPGSGQRGSVYRKVRGETGG